jgi:hypothetical protein
VPIGVIGVLLVTRYIPDLREEQVWPLDIKGFLLSGFGLSALVFGLGVAGPGFVAPSYVAALVGAGVVALALYIHHALRTPHPIIDLSLLRVPTFHAAVVGGFMFRMGLGAVPFLLPLMLQTGFGLTAFQSGSLTFVAAIGAMAMKTTAQPILRRFGFRRVLIINALISACFFVAYAFFTPATPHGAIMMLLLVGGFFRSLEFTALNAIGYADIEQQAMSRATSFASAGQQLSLSAGVSLGAAALEGARALHGGGALHYQDFQPAFLIVALVSASSMLFFWPLAKNAGAALTGRST